MPTYLVSYDLIAKDGEVRDYQPVYDALDKFDNFEALYSAYLVDASSIATIKAALLSALRKNDRYFITRLRKGEFTYRAIKGVNPWLAGHPPA